MHAKHPHHKLLIFGRYKSFDDMPSWLLGALGGGAFLPAAYYGALTAKVTQPLIDATNKAGFAWIGVALWLCVGLIALAALYYFWIAKRCGDILYKRWLK